MNFSEPAHTHTQISKESLNKTKAAKKTPPLRAAGILSPGGHPGGACNTRGLIYFFSPARLQPTDRPTREYRGFMARLGFVLHLTCFIHTRYAPALIPELIGYEYALRAPCFYLRNNRHSRGRCKNSLLRLMAVVTLIMVL